MENSLETATELVKAIKENLLKPMYQGINRHTDNSKEEILSKINSLEEEIKNIKNQQKAFFDALKNITWDD